MPGCSVQHVGGLDRVDRAADPAGEPRTAASTPGADVATPDRRTPVRPVAVRGDCVGTDLVLPRSGPADRLGCRCQSGSSEGDRVAGRLSRSGRGINRGAKSRRLVMRAAPEGADQRPDGAGRGSCGAECWPFESARAGCAACWPVPARPGLHRDGARHTSESERPPVSGQPGDAPWPTSCPATNDGSSSSRRCT